MMITIVLTNPAFRISTMLNSEYLVFQDHISASRKATCLLVHIAINLKRMMHGLGERLRIFVILKISIFRTTFDMQNDFCGQGSGHLVGWENSPVSRINRITWIRQEEKICSDANFIEITRSNHARHPCHRLSGGLAMWSRELYAYCLFFFT